MTTKEQVIELAKQAGLINIFGGPSDEALETYTRLVREAYRAELLAGVEWPEPEGKTPHVRGGFDHWWTETQVQQMLAAAVLKARNQALEDAAAEFAGAKTQSGEDIAAAIRNMKDNT